MGIYFELKINLLVIRHVAVIPEDKTIWLPFFTGFASFALIKHAGQLIFLPLVLLLFISDFLLKNIFQYRFIKLFRKFVFYRQLQSL